MKWVIQKEDLVQYNTHYHGKETGYAENYSALTVGMPKIYIVVAGDSEITLVRLNLKLEQKSIEKISVSEITSIKVSGTLNKKVVITTTSNKYRLIFKTMAIGIKDEQQRIIQYLSQLKIVVKR